MNEYLQNSNDTYTKQAFSKGRKRILPKAVAGLCSFVADLFYRTAEYRTYRGFRLFAVDGIRLNLPDSNMLMAHYGTQKSTGEQIQALCSAVYDVLNGIILDTALEPHNANERRIFAEQLVNNNIFMPGKDIFILDRGYPSGELLDLFSKNRHYYVMRRQEPFLRSVRYHAPDSIVTHRFAGCT